MFTDAAILTQVQNVSRTLDLLPSAVDRYLKFHPRTDVDVICNTLQDHNSSTLQAVIDAHVDKHPEGPSKDDLMDAYDQIRSAAHDMHSCSDVTALMLDRICIWTLQDIYPY